MFSFACWHTAFQPAQATLLIHHGSTNACIDICQVSRGWQSIHSPSAGADVTAQDAAKQHRASVSSLSLQTLAVVGHTTQLQQQGIAAHLWVVTILPQPLKHCSDVSRLV